MTKALIEKLKEYRSRYHNEVAVAEVIVDDCIDIVKQHSDWIPCSERLPDTSGKYLVCYSQEHYDGTYFKRFDVVDFYIGINRFDFYHRFTTHWQPLPQPPSEVQP